jgi:hypothetical protein
LPAGSVAAAAQAASKVRESSALVASVAPRAAPADGQILVVDVGGHPEAGVARALRLSRFEATLRVRRGGLQLLRRGAPDELRHEAERLRAEGLAVFLVAESEARPRIIPVIGGRQIGGVLHFRTEAGPLDVASSDLLLIVRGPIRREYQAREVERKKPHTATLEEGYRFHLHRRLDPAPLEVDPAGFAFAQQAPLTGSSLLELKTWLQSLGESVPVDDGFRLLPPALGEAAEEAGSLAALRGARGASLSPGREAAIVLDNVAQFRFYSGWRAAIERVRSR